MADVQGKAAKSRDRASSPTPSPYLWKSADKTPAAVGAPSAVQLGARAPGWLLSTLPVFRDGAPPGQGKFSRVLWQPKSTQTLQGAVEKSEFDVLGNI